MNLEKLEIKLLHPDAKVPTRSHDSDAGLDLYWSGGLTNPPPFVRQYTKYHTGIAVNIPKGYVGLIWPRSGLTIKTGYDTLAGVIDAGYHGEIIVISDTDLKAIPGDKIAQLIIQPVELPVPVVVTEFSDDSQRGTNGFGSTDARQLSLPLENGFNG